MASLVAFAHAVVNVGERKYFLEFQLRSCDVKPTFVGHRRRHFQLFFYLFNGLSSMNISSMYVKRGLAHLFSNTSKSTKKIDTLDKKIQAATPCSRYCSSRWSFLFLLSSFVVNVAAPHSEKAFCSKLNPDVCDSTLWALLMSFIWATAICPCHYFCCFRITVQYIVNTEFLENGSTMTKEKIRKKNDLYFWQ